MRNSNTFFKSMKVKVPNRSSHSLSHFSAGTGKVGQLIPMLCKEVIAGSKINLTPVLEAQLAPLATDAFMKCDYRLEFFFVPTRLCQKANAKWLTGEPDSAGKYAQKEVFILGTGWTDVLAKQYFGAGSLLDYLGWKFSDADMTAMASNNVYPKLPIDKLIAYHLIWDSFYRNSKIQRSCFLDEVPSSSSAFNSNISKYVLNSANYGSNPYTIHTNTITPSGTQQILADSHNIFNLRQRNWDLDYFTASMTSAQQGNPQSVSFDTSGATGNFTIAALRSANSLQMWCERNGISGYDYNSWLYAHYGIAPKDTLTGKPLYLGRAIMDVRTKGIYATSGVTSSVGTNSNATNYFNTAQGTSVGRSYGSGAKNVLHGFVAEEPGYLFVIGSLVPRVTYSNGIIRENLHYTEDGSVTDMANPLLQNLGNQPIYTEELSPSRIGSVFAYIDRYAEFMSMHDELHGLLRDGQDLSAYALQRSFGTLLPQLGSSFIQIPSNYLNQVLQYTGNQLSTQDNFDFWYDIYFDFKVSHPLHEYSIPSLQDPAYEHGKTVVIARTGQKLG